MKYYIISGEASGDLHGSNLIKELKKQDQSAEFRAWGGDLMQSAGAKLVKHYKDLAFMGFTEVVMNLKTILNNISFCKNDIKNYQPDVVILIDYPGFNLRMAGYVKKLGIRVFYYISPQIWAWKQSRVHKIKKVVDKMYVILPFETAFYKQFDYDVTFVGHPLLDAVEKIDESKIQGFRKENQLDERPIIALLPGSRKQEIERMLLVMLSVKDQFPNYQFVIAGAPSQSIDYYQSIVTSDVKIVNNQTYLLLKNAIAALVTSGTATLETALFNVPQVVCYKGGTISYHIAKRLIKVDYISLVNLILNKEVVKELIQDECNTINLITELKAILPGGIKQKAVLDDYILLKQKLGGGGASEFTASAMLKTLRESN